MTATSHPSATPGREGHTPGPWRVEGYDKNDQRIVRGEHIEICTCWHHSVGSIEKEMEANARLIAAAPDMLSALQCALFDLEQTYSHVSSVSADRIKTETIPLCRVAIAKATGGKP